MKPIYEPKGKAKEYGDYAINIYTGCPHECFYCFAPSVLRKVKDDFHKCVEPRKNIVEEVKKQIEREKITGKLIHLCFTCDPYPCGYDTTTTREIIKVIKGSGNNVQILTKGDGSRDFDLLDENDWYGITVTCMSDLREKSEPNALSAARRHGGLVAAKTRGIKTWVSCEPVLNAEDILWYLANSHNVIDKVKIGKLNYHPSDIDWKSFGKKAEALCKSLGIDYYIKDGLREEMNK